MARSSMDTLISRVRGLAGVGTAAFSIDGTSYFSDDHIEEALDRHRTSFRRERLQPVVDQLNGTAQYLEYWASRGQLESTDGGTAVLVVEDGAGSTVGTADYSVDEQRGVVTFGANQAGTAYYLDAEAYDVFAAAADVVEQWASSAAGGFDFSTDNQSFNRSQQAGGLRSHAKSLRRRSLAGSARVLRSDERRH